jgi:hypothetical protein
MDSKKVFLVSITQEGKFFVARCPELGVTSQGESLVEAQKNLRVSVNPYWTTVEVEAKVADA